MVSARHAAFAASLLAALGACAPAGPPPIRAGMECATCAMAIQDLRFACERRVDGSWRRYDAIECLIRDRATPEGAWLTDYDAVTLHAADSMWVVRGSFPSPMGGGFAAFLSAEDARRVADQTRGRVDRLAAFLGDAGGAAP